MSSFRQAIVGIAGGVMIAIATVALFVAATGGSGPTEVFVPWSFAYLIGGGLMIVSARRF